MKVQVEKVSSIVQKLSIELEPQQVEQELSRAYVELSRQVKMPGFRPGKIPRRLLEGRYKNEVEADVVRRLQQRGMIDAIGEKKVPAIGDPRFAGGKIVTGQPFAFTVELEVKPEVEAKEWKGLVLPKHDTSVADAQIDEQIERMRSSRVSLEPLTGRDVVQLGDVCVIDFDATTGGQPFAGNKGRDTTVEATAGELVEGNMPQLEGVKVGESKTFDYAFPADFRNEEMKGKTATFVCTVKELKQKVTPPLDEVFAKQMGADSVDALKAKVRGDLERAAKNRVAVDERNDLFAKLIEKNAFEIPNALIEHGVDTMMNGAFQQMFQSGIDPRSLSLDWNQLRGSMKPKAESEVRGQLLLEAICRQEKIEVGDGDVDAKLASLAEESGMQLAVMKAQYKTEQQLASLKNRILEEKAISLVRQHAKFE